MKKTFIVKIICIFIFLILLNCRFSFADDIEEENDLDIQEIIQTSSNATEDLDILSRYAVAFDRTSKTVLWSKSENTKVPMASTTKIMTSIILMEKYGDNLNLEVEVCKQAANVGGSRLGLKLGDKITLNDLLYGLMLRSGNDAAIQIAVTVSGSVDEFSKLMNDKAKKLGLTNTHFTCPHGLDNPEHYTTAYELALITDYALNIKKIAEVVNTKIYTVTINGYGKTITNTNELLGYLEGVNGVKTGFTNGAGRCLVTSCLRDNFNIIVVVLGADTKKIRTKDSVKIINYIYDNYELINLENKINEEFENWQKINEKRIFVNKGASNEVKTNLGQIKYKYYPIKKGQGNNISIEINGIINLEAPVEKNRKIGEVKVFAVGKEVEKINILVKDEIKKNGILDYIKIFMKYCNGELCSSKIRRDS